MAIACATFSHFQPCAPSVRPLPMATAKKSAPAPAKKTVKAAAPAKAPAKKLATKAAAKPATKFEAVQAATPVRRNAPKPRRG